MNNLYEEAAVRDEVDLEQYILLLRSHFLLLVIITIISAAAAFVGSQFVTPVYQASTTVLIDEAPSTDIADFNALLASERRARTYAQLLTEQPILETTIERLDIAMDATNLREVVEARRMPDTQLIEVLAEHTDPVMAANIANTIVEVFTEQTEAIQASRYEDTKESLLGQLADLEKQIGDTSAAIESLGNAAEDKAERDRLEALLVQYRQSYTNLLQSYEQVRIAEAQSSSNVIPVKRATPPDRPIRPNTLLNTSVAGMLGLVLAITGIFIRETLDDTLKSPDDVTRQLGLPILGLIAHIEAEEDLELLITASQPRSPVAEAFRSLRTNIQYAGVDRVLKTILITSPSPEDGKSTVASNLAVAVAQNNRRVVLMEGDLRHPAAHKRLGLPNETGISALFVEPLEYLDSVMQKTHVPGLSLLSSGGTPPNPSELLDSERARRILDSVGRQADVVLIDAPPVMAVADAVILSPYVDGVLLVVRMGKTRVAASRQALEQLQRVGANVIGVVITSIDVKSVRYSRYYHYYSYYGRYDEAETASKPDKHNGSGNGAGEGSRLPEPALEGVSYATGGTTQATGVPAYTTGSGPGYAAGGVATRPTTRTRLAIPKRPSTRSILTAVLGGCMAIGGVGITTLGAGQIAGGAVLGLGVGIMGAGLFIAGIGQMLGRSALSIGLIVAGVGALGVGATYIITGVDYLQSEVAIAGWGLIAIGAWLLVVGAGTIAFGVKRTWGIKRSPR
jgi:capsular exopolysaccharide synthesis family protein